MGNLEITDVKVRKTYPEGRLRGLVSITLNESFAIHDIKVIEGQDRYFVAMPSRKEGNGSFRDIVHPINEDTRHSLEQTILDAYEKQLLLQEAEEETEKKQNFPES